MWLLSPLYPLVTLGVEPECRQGAGPLVTEGVGLLSRLEVRPLVTLGVAALAVEGHGTAPGRDNSG